jgi:hypothetical protein
MTRGITPVCRTTRGSRVPSGRDKPLQLSRRGRSGRCPGCGLRAQQARSGSGSRRGAGAEPRRETEGLLRGLAPARPFRPMPRGRCGLLARPCDRRLLAEGWHGACLPPPSDGTTKLPASPLANQPCPDRRLPKRPSPLPPLRRREGSANRRLGQHVLGPRRFTSSGHVSTWPEGAARRLTACHQTVMGSAHCRAYPFRR